MSENDLDRFVGRLRRMRRRGRPIPVVRSIESTPVSPARARRIRDLLHLVSA